MAESAEEFFTDDRLADSNLHDSASLIQTFLAEDATASETARNLTASFHAPAAANASEVLEECIVGAAEQLWDTHDALVKLVCELRSQQQQRTGENDLSEFDQSLAYSLGERWLRYGDPDPASSWRDQARLEWTNLNHFAALLYMSGVQQLSSFGEKTLEFTMKRGGWRINWEGPDNTSDSIVALQGHAPAAAHWIMICGQRLYDKCDNIQAKWATWMADMTWIAGQAAQAELEETQSLCRQAQAEMERIQG